MKNCIKIIKKKNANEVGKEASNIVLNEIKKKPSLVLGLATGRTMIQFYRELVKLFKNKKINFSKVKTFNIDEYYGIDWNDLRSYKKYMDKNLFEKIKIKKENINFLDGSKKNWRKECLDYEKKIKEVGGIDLQILGIGRNGHIALNEPGSSFKSKTRKIKLNEETRRANVGFFNSIKEVPRYALTSGIKTIMGSKKILLLATGKEKRDVVKKALKGKITKKVPASILRKHRNVIFILDSNALG